jgi:DNA-binding FadR family transcriptional regulator
MTMSRDKAELAEAPAKPANPVREPFQGHPAQRMRAADYVFETLSRAILNGEFLPGAELPPQRELSKQFSVSPLVIRQATHRLEELGLVTVKQGSTTLVRDPSQADVRVIQLQLELATPGDAMALAARETQALSALSILALAERRISEPELQALDKLVDQMPAEAAFNDSLHFRVSFWGLLAMATKNPVLQHQVRWWAGVMRNLERRKGADPTGTGLDRIVRRNTYRGLVRALRKGRGAVEYWTKIVEPVLDWAESQPRHASKHQPAASSGEPKTGGQDSRRTA